MNCFDGRIERAGRDSRDRQRTPGTRVWQTAVLAAVAAGLMSTTAMAGPTWEEDSDGGGDAGESAGTAQTTGGTGQLKFIEGRTDNADAFAGEAVFGIDDFVDLYLVRVCNPKDFFLSTRPADGGFAEFDSQLYVFTAPAGPPNIFGLLGNVNASGAGEESFLGPVATDGSGAILNTPRRYWVGVSINARRPASGGGQIFDFASGTEVSGPDGPGGGGPLVQWAGPPIGGDGNYRIVLGGTTFGDQPFLDCNCNGIADSCDIAFGQSQDANDDRIPDECSCRADIDMNGAVEFGDLVTLLAAAGSCPPMGGCPADLNCDGTVSFADLTSLLASWGPCS